MSRKRIVLRRSSGGRWKGAGREDGHLFLYMASPSLCELFLSHVQPFFIYADQSLSTNRSTSVITLNSRINSLSDDTPINNVTH